MLSSPGVEQQQKIGFDSLLSDSMAICEMPCVCEIAHKRSSDTPKKNQGVAAPIFKECNTIRTVKHILLNCKKLVNRRTEKNIISMTNVFLKTLFYWEVHPQQYKTTPITEKLYL